VLEPHARVGRRDGERNLRAQRREQVVDEACGGRAGPGWDNGAGGAGG
jgi:hypothetical protein